MGNIKLDIKSYYNPKKPDLREIKLKVDDEVLYSKLMRQQEIWELAKQFRYLDQELTKIANSIED